MYDGADDDVLNVMILPVSLAMQAVDAMARVIVIDEEEEEEERKQLVLDIVSAILFVLPFAGEALGAEVGTVLGARGGSARREASDMSDRAKLRRGMKDGDIGKMGLVFKNNDDAVQKSEDLSFGLSWLRPLHRKIRQDARRVA